MKNDLGVDPYEWFDNPLDSMPIATNDRFDMYGSSDADYAFMKYQVERKDPPAELMEVPTSVTSPKPPKKKKEEKKTPHHIAYEIATAKYNPFSVGGSENISELGGSENRI
tara:strand:- start:66 stop:398 length:333 start_codon:yes stop_codon:yes gene_type:complete